MTPAAEIHSCASIVSRASKARPRLRRGEFARPQFATAQGWRPGTGDNEDREGSPTGESAMNDIILFSYPTIAALGAFASLSLAVAALNAEKTNPSRLRAPARRPRSR
jgi:hypothetical protein